MSPHAQDDPGLPYPPRQPILSSPVSYAADLQGNDDNIHRVALFETKSIAESNECLNPINVDDAFEAWRGWEVRPTIQHVVQKEDKQYMTS